MARTASTMLELGTPLPSFSLPEPKTGRAVSTGDFADAKAVVVMFICNHCPYVKRIADGLARFGHDYVGRGVAIVAISSNDIVNYPDDSPDEMVKEAEARGYPFPYLFDEDQSVAKAFQAACTPELYVFDGDQKLAYRGQFDDARPGNDTPVTGADVRNAVDAILNGGEVASEQVPSVGCNIKWREGNAPAYFG